MYVFKIGNIQKSNSHLVKRASVWKKGNYVELSRTSNEKAQAGPVQRKLFFIFCFYDCCDFVFSGVFLFFFAAVFWYLKHDVSPAVVLEISH